MKEFPCSSSQQQRYMDSSYYDTYSYSNMENDLSDYTHTSNIVRWKSGKRVDPRLLALLESFGEIYTNRHEFFGKIFHENHDELFRKIGDGMKRKKEMKKARSMTRSMSMRAIKQRGIDDEIDGLRLERFKVKTPIVIVTGPNGPGPTSQRGQVQTTQGSNDAK